MIRETRVFEGIRMQHHTRRLSLTLVAMLLLGSGVTAQTLGTKEDFSAVAVVNNNLGSGAGTVLFSVTRWSTDAERDRLVDTLLKKGPDALLEVLRDNRSTGTIRTPDSLG